jgi:tellurite resistance protein TehA-like permease
VIIKLRRGRRIPFNLGWWAFTFPIGKIHLTLFP